MGTKRTKIFTHNEPQVNTDWKNLYFFLQCQQRCSGRGVCAYPGWPGYISCWSMTSGTILERRALIGPQWSLGENGRITRNSIRLKRSHHEEPPSLKQGRYRGDTGTLVECCATTNEAGRGYLQPLSTIGHKSRWALLLPCFSGLFLTSLVE